MSRLLCGDAKPPVHGRKKQWRFDARLKGTATSMKCATAIQEYSAAERRALAEEKPAAREHKVLTKDVFRAV